MPKPTGQTIFCDDIRQEIGGKLTFVGVYSNSMIIFTDDERVILPTFSFSSRILIPTKYRFSKAVVALKIHFDDADVDVFRSEDIPGDEHAKLNDAKRETDEVSVLALQATLSPFPLPGSCRILSRAYFDKHEVKLGSLTVSVRPANTPPRPATQGD